MKEIVAEIIYEHTGKLDQEIVFKTSKGMNQEIKEIANDNGMSIDDLINNAIIYYFSHNVLVDVE